MIAPKSNLGLLVVVVLRRRRLLEDSTTAPHCIADKASKSINDNRCIMYTVNYLFRMSISSRQVSI